MPLLHWLDPVDFSRQSWRNGAGSTLELARDARDDWRWRISVAVLETDTRFSALPQTRRLFVPLDSPLQLGFDDREPVDVARLQVLAFAGDAAPSCTLPHGPGRAFNVMLRDEARATLIARPLLGTMLLPTTPGTRWLVYPAAGQLTLQCADERLALAAGEAAWAAPGDGLRCLIEGAGDVVLVRLDAD